MPSRPQPLRARFLGSMGLVALAFAMPAFAASVPAPAAQSRGKDATTRVVAPKGAVQAAKVAAKETIDAGFAGTRGTGLGRSDFEELVGIRDNDPMFAMPRVDGAGGGDGEGGVAGGGGQCPPVVSTHTNANFEGGQFIVQAGFAEQEIAAASYTVSAADFPLRIDLCEMIFATSNTTVTTTTKWSVLVWEGTPATGTLKYVFSSNGIDLPHLVMQPGTNGTNIQFGIDPGDPEQMIIQDNGTQTFSIGYRIDDHNLQTSNPCLVAPPSTANAFPTTDVGGLQAPTRNWLFAVDCGAFGCPAGWSNFQQLPSLCRPSGDWVMRVTWTPTNCQVAGACCLPNGSCDSLTEANCAVLGGNFIGEGTTCGPNTCTDALVPCCFQATGGCLTLSAASCAAAGGVAGPAGQTCATYVCFPIGACCLPNGSCLPGVSPAACAAQNGVFQGNGTQCSAGLCPEPTGASCFPTGFCLILTEEQALEAGATWYGPGTTCGDLNGNGTPDICEQGRPEDLNDDGVVNAQDLAILLGAWGATGGPADLNGDGVVGAADLAQLLSAWD